MVCQPGTRSPDERCRKQGPFWEGGIPTAFPRRDELLYMIVEQFKNQDPVPVYRRFRDSGRLAPEGLKYVSSWIDEELKRCFQLMETDDRKLLDEWIARWSDIVEFEVYPVISSQEATEKVARYL
jgi:hypothetical protein